MPAAKPEFTSITLANDEFEVVGESSADDITCTFWHIDQGGEIMGGVARMTANAVAAGAPVAAGDAASGRWSIPADNPGRFATGQPATVVGIEVRIRRDGGSPELECYAWMRNLTLD